jgi:hypothetical protein
MNTKSATQFLPSLLKRRESKLKNKIHIITERLTKIKSNERDHTPAPFPQSLNFPKLNQAYKYIPMIFKKKSKKPSSQVASQKSSTGKKRTASKNQ